MTLATTPPVEDYLEDAVTLLHPIPFQFQLATDIRCSRILAGVETPLTLGADFTVAGGAGGTGTVTKMSAGVVGTIFRVERVTTRAQTTDYTPGDPFPAEVHEAALDHAAAVDQEQDVKISDVESRSLRVPAGEAIAALLSTASRIGKWLGFDGAGNPALLDPPVGAPGGNVMAIGLFTALATMAVPLGTTLIHTSGHSAAEKGAAIYVEDATLDDAAVAAFPNARVKTANGRYFRLSSYQLLGPYEFGCVDSNDGVLRDTGPAMQKMLDYLHAIAVNPSTAGGFYKGTAPINWPHGHFHSAATTLEPTATINWLGAGSGLNGPSGGAGTLITFGANTSGVRLPFPTTSGDTGVVAAHDATASFYARGMCWQSTFNLTAANEAEFEGFSARAPYFLEDIYIKSFPGTGFLARAGNVTGLGNIGGNVSCSRAINVKVEGCRDGFIIGGGDANIMQFHGCWAYQNTRYGVRTENGAGSNLWTGLHCASNGLIANVGIYTQTSSGGNRYALKEGGNPLNPPSGTTADTADWDYIEAGGAVANLIPAYVATPGLFRSGGDMVAAGSDSSRFFECYSENGGFSQFALTSVVEGGTIGDQYFRGGGRIHMRSDGMQLTQSPNCSWRLKHRSTQSAIVALDEAGVEHSMIIFSKTAGNDYFARDATAHRFFTAPYGGAWTLRGTFSINGAELPAGHAFYVNGQQVLGARQTGCPAAATDAATTLALANFLRAALLAHGAVS